MDEQNREVNIGEQPAYRPMKWYNFRVKFLMVIGGVSGIICGVIAASTVMYSVMAEVAAAELADAQFIEYFYTGNKVFDIIFGIAFLLIGIANFTVRSRMKKFTADALKKFYIFIIAEQAVFYVYDIAFAFVTNTKLDIADTVLFSLATSVVLVVLEFDYFNKRKALFVN